MRHVISFTATLLAAIVFAACGEDGFRYELGPEAALDISPNGIIFGDVPRGEVARRIVTIRHIGSSGTVRLDPIRLETTSPDLAIGEIEATTLAPGEETRVQIVYTSAHDEPDEGVLVIGHNLAGDPETQVAISTPGQRGRLIAQPPVLDFGVVQEAAPRAMPLRVFNAGTAPATLTDWLADGSDDFTVEIPAGATINPGESLEIFMTYAPRGRDKDDAIVTLLTERADVSLDVTVRGEEETPVLAVEPGLIQLGWVRPGERAARDVVVRNDGNTALVVERLELVESHPELALTARPAGPVTLEPGQAFTFGVVFSPRGLVPMAVDPLGKVRFTSSDAARNPFIAPVYGAAGIPALVVVPDDVIDFAYVAGGFKAVRKAVVLNQGVEAVDLTGVELVDATSDELAIDTTLTYPHTLNPGESVEIQLSFDNRGERDGAETARLFIRSTDPVVPVYPLDVIARRAQRPACEVAFVPELLAMGAARVGTTISKTLTLQNVGSGNCEYRSHVFDACLAQRFGIGYRFVCDSRIAFNPFELTGGPAPGDVVGPGEAIAFPISFTAPPVTAAIGRESYYARIAATLFDPNSNRLAFATPPGGTNGDINIRAEAANGTIRVEPGSIDFGTVRTDCASYPSAVRIRSTGPMATTVSAVEAVGCGGSVRIDGPAAPFVIDGFATTTLILTFAPDSEPPVGCTLRITNDSQNLPVAEVALAGAGTSLRTQTDRFRQLPAPKVDVLFVVDDSYSMADDQERLKQSLPAMAELARSWGQDYRFAVTTTDTMNIRGQFKGLPRYVDASMDPAIFAQNLVVGVVGFWIERGLEAVDLALYRRAERTDIACRNVPNQCPSDDGEGIPLSCLEGFCSGRNWGFLRDDADLVVIMVSDEEDGSVQPVQYYINRFAALKDPARGVGVTFHAIVVTPEKGCLGGFGTPALRYIAAAEALNGHVADLCADNFAAEFNDVAARSFGLKDRFYPSLQPDPSTLVVHVNGVQCTEGWSWNAAARAVVFEEGAACFPPFDAEIELTYDILCPTPR